jgi:hypothetical protein
MFRLRTFAVQGSCRCRSDFASLEARAHPLGSRHCGVPCSWSVRELASDTVNIPYLAQQNANVVRGQVENVRCDRRDILRSISALSSWTTSRTMSWTTQNPRTVCLGLGRSRLGTVLALYQDSQGLVMDVPKISDKVEAWRIATDCSLHKRSGHVNATSPLVVQPRRRWVAPTDCALVGVASPNESTEGSGLRSLEAERYGSAVMARRYVHMHDHLSAMKGKHLHAVCVRWHQANSNQTGNYSSRIVAYQTLLQRAATTRACCACLLVLALRAPAR